MAALRCAGVWRCVKRVRCAQPLFATSSCLAFKNEVLELSGQSSLVGLAHQHRKTGNFCPQRNHGENLTLSCNSSYSNQTGLYSLINIKYKGSDEAVLRSYTTFVTLAATLLNIDISDRILLPTSIERHTVLKSPHIYKKHRAQYEVRTHARMLQVRNVTCDTSDVFLEYIQRNLPEGVSMSVEQTELESLPQLPPQAQEFLEQQKNNQE
ncbi:28S ribosomal protein S10, mitochondrial [Desmophyllum pertusum]|uniref:Small ribosomal subunit protein uS10m n=1 Tax=Desmophyllum pertusum TaxID=174260 RepID=A0A9W9YMZ4_9CNID|nr:28S ribosomal protein S10, mitochondrial [Desmophyllum pertusum]